MSAAGGQRVEVVRGRIDPALSDRLVRFWTSRGALDAAAARERLAEVVCVRFDAEERIVGVNSAYAGEAPLIGRRMWMYRRFLSPGADEAADGEMLAAAREELARGFGGGPGEPIGICLLIADRALIARARDAVWPGELLFAGYAEGGVQVRVSYFEGARI